MWINNCSGPQDQRVDPSLVSLRALTGTLPEGLERGAFIVSGHGVHLAVLSAALILRAAYALGFNSHVARCHLVA